MGMNINFIKISSENVAGYPIINGQILFTKDTDEFFLDLGDSRNKITDVVSVTSLPSIGAPNKLYCQFSDNAIYKWDGTKWQLIGVSESPIDGKLYGRKPLCYGCAVDG